MIVYERNATNDLRLSQRIELDFLPDNPCTLFPLKKLTKAITPNGDLLVTGVSNIKTALDHNPETLSHSKVVRISLAQLGDTYFGKGSGQTTKPIIEPVLMDVTGKVNGSTTTLEVTYNDATWLYTTSWRAVGLTRCKLHQS